MKIHRFSGMASDRDFKIFSDRNYLESPGWSMSARFAGILATLIAHYGDEFTYDDMAAMAWANGLEDWEFSTDRTDTQTLKSTTVYIPEKSDGTQFDFPTGWYAKYYGPWVNGSLTVDLPEMETPLPAPVVVIPPPVQPAYIAPPEPPAYIAPAQPTQSAPVQVETIETAAVPVYDPPAMTTPIIQPEYQNMIPAGAQMPAQKTDGENNFMPWLIGGGAILLLILLGNKKGKRKR